MYKSFEDYQLVKDTKVRKLTVSTVRTFSERTEAVFRIADRKNLGQFKDDKSFFNVKNTTARSIFKDSVLNRLKAPTDEWLGTNSQEELLRRMDGNWKEGVDKLFEIITGYEAMRVPSIRRKLVWQDHGDFVDIQRVYSGTLDKAWQGMTKQTVQRPPRVTLYVPLGGNCNVSSERMFFAGAPGVVFSDALQAAGYNVRIVGYNIVNGLTGYGDCERSNLTLTEVKGYTDPLDLSTMACCVCSSGWFRIAIFSEYICRPDRDVYGWLGHNNNKEREVLRYMAESHDPTSVPVLCKHTLSAKDAISEVNRLTRMFNENSIEKANEKFIENPDSQEEALPDPDDDDDDDYDF